MDDLDSNFKNSTFDREMTMTSAGRSVAAQQKATIKPSPRASDAKSAMRPMTATTKSSKLDKTPQPNKEEEFHQSLIKTIDHNIKGDGLKKRKLQLQDKLGSVYTDQ